MTSRTPDLPTPPDAAGRGFWSNPQKWPSLDPKGFVFLARAVHEIGRAKFPAGDNAWTGGEPTALEQRRFTIARHKQDHAAQPAVLEIEKKCEKCLDVQGAIVQGCIDGELIAAYRRNGDWTQIPAKSWNTEHWASAFARCKCPVGFRFSIWFDASTGYEHIYLTRESLSGFIAALSTPQAGPKRPHSSANYPPVLRRPRQRMTVATSCNGSTKKRRRRASFQA